eukprot:gb/GECH01000518.1/.p1 GENE.gb/GECH01000518.1/~~gb/GECH01000518.1/.p1  ORF type:complete len:266 (+),score=66.37 gb/GECH01000518.1/:1-798(+)
MNTKIAAPTFPSLPLEFKSIIPFLPAFNEEHLNIVIKTVLTLFKDTVHSQQHTQQHADSSNDHRSFKVLQRCKAVSEEMKQNLQDFIPSIKRQNTRENAQSIIDSGVFNAVFTGFFLLLKTFIRNQTTSNELKQHATESGIPEQVITLFSDVLQQYGPRLRQIAEDGAAHRGWHHTMNGLRWRVDVTISSNAMHRVFKPVVLLELDLTAPDGSRKMRTMEVSVEMFHELRFAVASVLKRMQEIEGHPVFQQQQQQQLKQQLKQQK